MRRSISKTYRFQKMNSFRYNSEAKVKKCQEELDDVIQNEGGDGRTGKSSKRKSEKKTKLICNCKSSKCLKHYCVCFKAGQACSKECNCYGCENNDDHPESRNKAITQALD